MHQVDLFLLFTEPLDAAGFSYMVSGSVAGMVYGEPRLTNDIDIVLAIESSKTNKLAELFPLESFYCPPIDVLNIESRRSHRGHFNLIHHASGYKADVFPSGTDPLQAWGLEHRQCIELSDQRSIWIAPQEYVILRKLEYYREGGSEKHVLDIRGMLELSGDSLDMSVLDEWLPKLGVQAQWDLVSQ